MANSITRQLLIDAAQSRGLSVSYTGTNEYFLQLTNAAGHTEIFRGSRPTKSAANGFIVSKYKNLTMDFVSSLGYEVPAWSLQDTSSDINNAKQFLAANLPIVVKPLDGQQSLGVTVGVTTETQLEAALSLAMRHSMSGRIMLQHQLEGKLFRICTINGRLVAAALRSAAAVTGDGQRTVTELITALNSDPRRSETSNSPLKKVKLTDASDYLGGQRLDEILPAGEICRVSAIDSISAGGEAADVTASVHSDWHEFTTKVANGMGLYIAGFDIMCDDISQPLADNYVPLLEVNSAPGFKLHMYPTAGGQAINLAETLLDELFQS